MLTQAPSQQISNLATIPPTPHKLPTPIPISPSPTSTPTILNSIIYPGAKTISPNHYQSYDDPQVITAWYKSRIQLLGYTTRSFVTTKTNAHILNKLSASKTGKSILVEISQPNPNAQVKIVVTLDNQ